jgi:peptide/nickel transport system substrate-binding protein
VGRGTRRERRLRSAVAVAAVGVGALSLAACGSSSAAPTSVTPTHLTAVKGGTVTYAESSGSSPNWILPVVPGADATVANLTDFIPLMYQHLYVLDFNQPTIDYARSMGDKPVWSDGDRVVTLTLKHFVWRNGQTVTTRDVTFFINLERAAGVLLGDYEPGAFPYNVSSVTAVSSTTIKLTLVHPFNPTYFDVNDLIGITPLPQSVWDRTSLHGPVRSYDTTTAGADRVWKFLEGYAEKTDTYVSSNSIWGVTDGPFELKSFGGDASPDIFVPNPTYSGHRATIAEFEELPFTSNAAEYDDLRSGPSAVTVGYVPSSDIPTVGAVRHAGYDVTPTYSWFIDFVLPNFANPTDGKIFSQLYIRQALQEMIDQKTMIKSFFGGDGVVGDGPVPQWPPGNRYLDASERHNLYPFSLASADRLLGSHGWKLIGGVRTCESATLCGKGIRAGTKLDFQLLYPSGSSSMSGMMELFEADASRAGVVVNLREEPFDTVTGILSPCTPGKDGVTDSSPACTWQLGTWGGWTYGPFPSGGDTLFNAGNSGSYDNATVLKLISEVREAPTLSTFYTYESLVARDLPVLWLPQGASFTAIAKNLAGQGRIAAFGGLHPNWWYFTR